MKAGKPIRRWHWLAVLAVFLAAGGNVQAQHGVFLAGGGPIQRSIGGTATGNPLDSLGALFWNPATLSALERNEMSFGAEFLMPHARLSSQIGAGTLAPGFPATNLAGTNRSDSGTIVLPNFGLVHHVEATNLSLGLGVITVAGLSANYPASFTNPILTPPAPVGLGLGRTFAELQVFQIAPAASLQVTDQISIGFSPLINFASLKANPLLLSPPNDANRNGFATYSEGLHAHYHWGAGFQVGVYFAGQDGWNFGASFKSPQWFETFRFNTVDEVGLPRVDTARFDLPWIASLGMSYTGIERWIFAGDLRYIDYRNAAGFEGTGFQPNGAVRGLGWDSQIVVALGSQFQVTERLALRMGYTFNNNPQDETVAFFNVAAPTILEHTLYTGGSYSLTENLLFSLAYAHAFESEVSGPFIFPQGAVPGTLVRSQVSADAIVAGFTVNY